MFPTSLVPVFTSDSCTHVLPAARRKNTATLLEPSIEKAREPLPLRGKLQATRPAQSNNASDVSVGGEPPVRVSKSMSSTDPVATNFALYAPGAGNATKNGFSNGPCPDATSVPLPSVIR